MIENEIRMVENEKNGQKFLFFIFYTGSILFWPSTVCDRGLLTVLKKKKTCFGPFSRQDFFGPQWIKSWSESYKKWIKIRTDHVNS